jgi:tetratricopeptide (TPR) repeat protein
MLEALRGEAEDPKLYLDDLAALQQRRGELFIDMDRLEEARAAFGEGLRFAEALETLSPSDPAPRHRQARLQLAVGRLCENHEDDAAAVECYRRACGLLEALISEEPRPEWQADLAECWHYMTIVLERVGDLTGSEDAYRRAKAIAYPLWEEYPQEPRYHALANAIYMRWANSDLRHERTKEYEEAPDLAAEFKRDPGLVLGPEPVAFRLAGWAPKEEGVPIEGLPDGGFFHHTIEGSSNVLGEWTGEAWVYFRACAPGMKNLTRVIYRAADGSELHVNTEGTHAPPNVFKGSYLITGGTGRFEGASGKGTIIARDHLEHGVLIEQRGTIRRK